ncbi:MAG: 3-dehydroquinate synthase [Chloroflexi bacterium]|nr:3-dehydroquinate synthase [Chloroflexota bacterium]
MMTRHLVLAGLSGSGKTTVGCQAARILQAPFIDTDVLIEAREGMSIADLFQERGEAYFRTVEEEVVRSALAGPPAVISLGGGAVLSPRTRVRLAAQRTVWLDCPPEVLADRTHADGAAQKRPLLAAPDLVVRLTALWQERAEFYAQCQWCLDATIAPHLLAAQVVELTEAAAEHPQDLEIKTAASAEQRDYVVRVGRGVIADLPHILDRFSSSTRSFLVSDSGAWAALESIIQEALRPSTRETLATAFPDGEESKTLETASGLWTWLASQRAERREPLIAFGGGVVGDVSGFVAATYMRGIPFIQIPTTLLAQVDSSIGGKVAIDHPLAKNLIGSFKAPEFVLVDTTLLASLPARQISSGWAEVLKHGVIFDEELFSLMEQEGAALRRVRPDLTLSTVRRSLEIKARVVQEDEFERGPRILLNLGHTLGHAVEAAAGYGHFLHGEAVSLGMVAEAWMAVQLGLCSPSVLERLERALIGLNLPVRLDSIDPELVLQIAQRDKKVRQGKVVWVLPVRIGEARRTQDVPPELAARAVHYLLEG